MTESISKRILLVEDEALLAMTEKVQLEKYGYAVRTVTTGEKAVEAVKASSDIDLILMDINLGDGIDGTEAARIILKDQDIPIVFLSSHTEPEIVGKTEKITSYGYVVKNSSVTVLDASIKMAFRLFETRRLADDTFTHSLNGLCVHRLIRDESGNLHDCEYLRVNSSFERHTGLLSRNIVGRTIRDLYPGTDADDVIRLYDEVLSGRAYARQEMYFKPTQTWYEMSIFRTQEDEFTVVAHNITERKQADANLRKSEMRFRSFIENANDVVYSVSPEGLFTYVSPNWPDFMGEPAQEALGKSFERYVHPEDVHRCRDFLEKVLTTGEKQSSIKYRIRRKDGDWRWHVSTGSPLRDDAGNVTSYVGIARDVTETQQAEAALQASEEHLSATLQSIGDGVIACDREGKVVNINSAAEALTGWPTAEAAGRHLEDVFRIIDARTRRTAVNPVARTLADGVSVDLANHTALIARDGTEYQIADSCSPIRDAAGAVIGAVLVFRDVTREYQRREELRQSEKKLRQVIDLVPHFIFAKDVNGKYLLANAAVAEAHGTTPEELVGKSNYDFGSNKEETDFFLECDRKVIVSGTGLYNIEEPITDSTGARRYLETTKIPFTTSGAEIPAILAVSVDITERKQYTENLKQIEWMLSAKKDGKKDYLSEYGDLTELNKNGLILSSLGKDQLIKFSAEYLDLMETSSAVYERNGDYSLGLFSSSWCRLMDLASRRRCRTDDNKEALRCGKWLCHDSCWGASMKAINSGKPADVECAGGLRLYAVPIRARGEVIGAINFGYGNPPDDALELQKLSDLYQIPIEELQKTSREYQIRPQFIIDYAKSRIEASAKSIGLLVERKLAEEEIQKQLAEKEILLREVHHRVKNNIASIESLLSLQARSTAHAEVKAALQDTISRVQSTRVLYDKLLLSKDLNEISIKDYAESLVDSLVTVYGPERGVTIERHIADFEIDARKASIIGIILNELLTNVFKYAFGDRADGVVSVSIDKEENAVTLIIQDNGCGFDERALKNESPGFGLTIVKMLVEQLGGTHSLSNDHGARSVVRLEV